MAHGSKSLKPGAKRGPGRPSEYTPEKAELICLRIMAGENLLDICAMPGMPDWTTLCRWRLRHAEFAAAYARAREASAEILEAQAHRRASTATPEDAHAARLEVDTLKWAAAKRWPRVYGDTQTHKHEGEITLMTPEERRARIAQLQAKLLEGLVIEGVAEREDGGE